MTVRRQGIFVHLAPRAEGVYEDARELTIQIDKQTGHDLGVSLHRLFQTTLGVPERVRNLMLALDAELIGSPGSGGRSNASADTAY